MAGERTVKIRFTGVAKDLIATAKRAESALERYDRVASQLSRTAGRVASATAKMIAPAAGPALAALAAAGLGTAAALGSAGAALGAFGAVAASSQKQVNEAATKVKDLNDKISLYGEQARIQTSRGEDASKMLKKQANAALELEARLNLLPEPVRNATRQYLAMGRSWDSFVSKNQPQTYGILARGYALIGQNIDKLQPLFDLGAKAADRALASLERFAAGGGIERLVAFLTREGAPALDAIGRIVSSVGTLFGNLFSGTVAQGQGFLEFLARGAEAAAAWSENGGLERFLANVQSTGPSVFAALSDIASAAVNIAQAVTPLAPISIAVAQALAAIIAAVPPGVITAIVAGWIAYTVAVTAYGAIMGTITAVTKVWAAAQLALNFVLTANPIGLVIAGIALLIAGIVLIATKTTFFQDVWGAAWGWIQDAARAVADWFTGTVVPSLQRAFDQLMVVVRFVVSVWQSQFRLMAAIAQFLVDKYKAYIAALITIVMRIVTAAQDVYNKARDYFGRLVSYIAGLPGRVASAARGLFDGIKNAFRSAINYVIDGWNRLSFTLPSINTPFGKIGGTTLSTPNIGRLASGGWAQPGKTYLTGEQGPELLTTGKRAYVNNAGDTAAMLGGAPEVHVYIGDRELTDIVDVRIETKNRGTRRRAGARVSGAFA